MIWTIGILCLVGWLLGVSLIDDQPFVHVLLVLAAIAFGYALTKRRPHGKERARPPLEGQGHTGSRA